MSGGAGMLVWDGGNVKVKGMKDGGRKGKKGRSGQIEREGWAEEGRRRERNGCWKRDGRKEVKESGR